MALLLCSLNRSLFRQGQAHPYLGMDTAARPVPTTSHAGQLVGRYTVSPFCSTLSPPCQRSVNA